MAHAHPDPEWSLYPPWPWGAFLALAAAILALAAWLYQSRRLDLPRGTRWGLSGLRLGCLVLILACVSRPTVRRPIASNVDPNLVVAVDVSASMSIEDQDGPASRLDRFRRLAGDLGLFEALAQRYRLRLFEFDGGAREVATLAGLRPRGGVTDLAQSLSDLAQGAVDANTVGVVLITDGADTTGGDIGAASEPMERRGVPLLIAGTGSEEVRDIEVASISTRRIVRLNTTVEARVKLRQHGFGRHLAPVRVRRAGETAAEKEVAFLEETATAVFEFTPAEEGLLRYTVEVPVQAGEVIRENNRRDFSIFSSRRKIRVLYLEGSQYRRADRPLWEFQYLVQALLEDKDVEVIPLFRDNVEAAERAGISYLLHPDKGFPRTRKDLFKHDIVISSDIGMDQFTDGQLRNLVDFVGEFGGGYVMVGGWTSFGAGDYDDSVVDQMLPVDMLGRADRYTEGVQVRWELSPEAYEHPIMRLSMDPVKNRSIWKSMPSFYGYNNVLRAKPAATVLAVHPYESTPYGRKVLLAVQHYGKGRSMAFMPDTTAGWGKDFEDFFGESGDNRYFRHFWKNAIRWLAAYRINVPNQLVTVHTERNLYETGDKALAEVSVLNQDYQPSRDAEVEIDVRGPEGDTLRRRLAADLHRDGIYAGEFAIALPGLYHFHARARDAQGLVGDDEAEVEAQTSSREYRHYALNRQLLKALATATQGRYYGLDQLAELLGDLAEANRRTVQVETRDLWDHVLIYLAILGLLACEWVVRKKNGLL
ncbi:MAG: hypothetical protein HYU36_22405 [Planctomycetes bacterium]|nr:hypothetical protein [Planctomycetota bacterium]